MRRSLSEQHHRSPGDSVDLQSASMKGPPEHPKAMLFAVLLLALLAAVFGHRFHRIGGF